MAVLTAPFGGGVAPRPPEERFWPKVDVGHPLGCWEWTAGVAAGYGRFRVGSLSDGSRRVAPSHRWAYEHLVGAIPEGMVLDHLCMNKTCVNPDHLEPVTIGENVARALAGRRQSANHVARRIASRYGRAAA